MMNSADDNHSAGNDSAQNALVDWFRASTQYINAHRGKTFVVSLPGDALTSEHLNKLIADLTLLHTLGVKLVIVHGARPQIDAALAAAQLPNDYFAGVRITTPESIDTIAAVVGAQSIRLEALFSAGTQSASSAPLASTRGEALMVSRGNFLTAMPIGIRDGIDFHHTGRVRRVNAKAIDARLNDNALVLQSTLAYSLTGEVFNLTADEVAGQIAIALQADKLITLIPQDGITSDAGELIAALNPTDAAVLSARYSQSDIDVQRQLGSTLDACVNACTAGVKRAHLIGYQSNGALIRELFTRAGAGSLISDDSLDSLRAASIDDVAAILALIAPLEADGTLVVRSRERLETEIENFKVIELEGAIIACAALYRTTPSFGEIACIAIHPSYRKLGLGARLLQALNEEAKTLGMTQTFGLTTPAAHWFIDQGFVEGALSDLPEQRQALYNLQRKSKIFLRAI